MVFAISSGFFPVSILYKSITGRYRPVSYPGGPITARYRFIKNAYWVICHLAIYIPYSHKHHLMSRQLIFFLSVPLVWVGQYFTSFLSTSI